MKRFLIAALLAFGAVTLLGLQPASSGDPISGTVTATPATIEAGESVDIVLEGTCFVELTPNAVDPTEHGGHLHVIATITDPNGATVFTKTFPGAPTIEFSFSDTPTLGTYNVTADCEIDCDALVFEGAETANNNECDVAGREADSAENVVVIGSYTPGEFTVVEADAAPADVVAAAPTFTG